MIPTHVLTDLRTDSRVSSSAHDELRPRGSLISEGVISLIEEVEQFAEVDK